MNNQFQLIFDQKYFQHDEKKLEVVRETFKYINHWLFHIEHQGKVLDKPEMTGGGNWSYKMQLISKKLVIFNVIKIKVKL